MEGMGLALLYMALQLALLSHCRAIAEPLQSKARPSQSKNPIRYSQSNGNGCNHGGIVLARLASGSFGAAPPSHSR
jgi:hypothetical protein